jgi:hypothetical protein
MDDAVLPCFRRSDSECSATFLSKTTADCRELHSDRLSQSDNADLKVSWTDHPLNSSVAELMIQVDTMVLLNTAPMWEISEFMVQSVVDKRELPAPTKNFGN